MTSLADLRHARLRNQRLAGRRLGSAEDVVSWMGAVQAQEYGEAQWGLALRTRGATLKAIEQACDSGKILRTHVLRPTWHFVARCDIRWMLALTGPYVSKRMAPYNVKLGLDAATFKKSQTIIARALRGTQLTRQELKAELQRGGIAADGVQRLAHIVMQAELDAVICSGPRRGRHATYALFDERVPSTRTFSRDAALAELARRYFTSHGPAQLQDFVWWSGLPVGEARNGLALIEGDLMRDEVGGILYWSAAARPARPGPSSTYLLPIYDEYLIAYKDRRAAFERDDWSRSGQGDPFTAPIVSDGIVVGTWRRRFRGNTAIVTIACNRRPSTSERAAMHDAASAYARFLGAELQLSVSSSGRP